MFESLKDWMTCPVTIVPFEGVNASADKLFGEPYEILAYFTGEVTVLNNSSSNQVVSNTKIYYDPSKYSVNEQDRVLVDGHMRDILTISNYMDGNTGTSSIKVVYL